jgi:hypothetical protein
LEFVIWWVMGWHWHGMGMGVWEIDKSVELSDMAMGIWTFGFGRNGMDGKMDESS